MSAVAFLLRRAGHAEFAPRNDTEFELLRFLKSKFHQKHRVSVERVVSGTGLANVYEFFCSLGPFDPQVKAEFDQAGDMKVRATGGDAAARGRNDEGWHEKRRRSNALRTGLMSEAKILQY